MSAFLSAKRAARNAGDAVAAVILILGGAVLIAIASTIGG